MQIIPLTQGYCARVDDADFDWLMQWKWCAFVNNCARNVVYAVRGRRKDDVDKTSLIYMHRVLVAPGRLVVDHIDHDGLNNQRHNLRITTIQLNSANNRNSRNKHGFKGVVQRGNKFRARISIKKRDVRIGTYRTVEEAARAYDAAAIKEFGEFAQLNFPLATLRA